MFAAPLDDGVASGDGAVVEDHVTPDLAAEQRPILF